MRIDGLGLASAAIVLAFASFAHAQDAGGRMTGLKLDSDKPIEIESDQLEVRENEGVAVFTGNVSVVQGPTLMRSGKMTVYYAKDGNSGSATTGSADIDRLIVEGKVYVKSDNQVATADTGSFDMRTEVLVMTGKEVVLTEGENVVVGCKLTVQMATGLATLEGCGGGESGSGRVKMLLKPGSQDR